MGVSLFLFLFFYKIGNLIWFILVFLNKLLFIGLSINIVVILLFLKLYFCGFNFKVWYCSSNDIFKIFICGL